MHNDQATPTTRTSKRTKHLRVQVAATLHRRLRLLAADRDVAVGTLIAEAIEHFVEGAES